MWPSLRNVGSVWYLDINVIYIEGNSLHLGSRHCLRRVNEKGTPMEIFKLCFYYFYHPPWIPCTKILHPHQSWHNTLAYITIQSLYIS